MYICPIKCLLNGADAGFELVDNGKLALNLPWTEETCGISSVAFLFSSHYKSSTHTAISLSIIPFPKVEELPEGCENVNHLPSPDLFVPFINAAKQLKQPFEDVLKELCDSDSTTPICVISDMFLPWTVDSCSLFDTPRIVFSGMGVLPSVLERIVSLHVPCISSLLHSEPINFPSVPFPLNKTDFPDFVWRGDDKHPILPIVSEIRQAEHNSWGYVVNSFEQLEGDHVAAFENQKGTKAWLVGPLLLHDQSEKDSMNPGSKNVDQKQFSPYIKWLDQKMEGVGPGTVIYVAFGSQSYMTDSQMEEIALALGLEMAGQPFTAMGLEAGLMMVQERDANDDPMTVHHDVICDSVRELMRGDRGKKARERAQELGRKAKKAMEKGGSSGKKLDELIECLTLRQKNSKTTR
ncbi:GLYCOSYLTRANSFERASE [Salix viminalis]|uniref:GLYCOSYLTRANSFERASE n=1 Tax=Salix viminalis TaxID=40686 RepID=A0A9Q0UWK5_SALVM|nr:GLYCOSYLTRANSFERASE [Salix viminalis]